MESKEMKDLRRDRVTRKAHIVTLEITAISEQGVVTWLERIRFRYIADQSALWAKVKHELVKKDMLLTNLRIVEQFYGLYGLTEDEFFASAVKLMDLPIEKKKGAENE